MIYLCLILKNSSVVTAYKIWQKSWTEMLWSELYIGIKIYV